MKSQHSNERWDEWKSCKTIRGKSRFESKCWNPKAIDSAIRVRQRIPNQEIERKNRKLEKEIWKRFGHKRNGDWGLLKSNNRAICQNNKLDI